MGTAVAPAVTKLHIVLAGPGERRWHGTIRDRSLMTPTAVHAVIHAGYQDGYRHAELALVFDTGHELATGWDAPQPTPAVIAVVLEQTTPTVRDATGQAWYTEPGHGLWLRRRQWGPVEVGWAKEVGPPPWPWPHVGLRVQPAKWQVSGLVGWRMTALHAHTRLTATPPGPAAAAAGVLALALVAIHTRRRGRRRRHATRSQASPRPTPT